MITVKGHYRITLHGRYLRKDEEGNHNYSDGEPVDFDSFEEAQSLCDCIGDTIITAFGDEVYHTPTPPLD